MREESGAIIEQTLTGIDMQ